jgi:SAM-dependent methyltransferase
MHRAATVLTVITACSHYNNGSQVLGWVDADGDAPKRTFCDAGCGVGSLSIPLAQRGAKVAASDISQAMTTEAAARTKVYTYVLQGNTNVQVCMQACNAASSRADCMQVRKATGSCSGFWLLAVGACVHSAGNQLKCLTHACAQLYWSLALVLCLL